MSHDSFKYAFCFLSTTNKYCPRFFFLLSFIMFHYLIIKWSHRETNELLHEVCLVFVCSRNINMGNQPLKPLMQPPTFNVCQTQDRGMAAEMRQKDDNQKSKTNKPLLNIEDRRKLNEVVHCETFDKCEDKSKNISTIKEKYHL